jgi:hypothetical protein
MSMAKRLFNIRILLVVWWKNLNLEKKMDIVNDANEFDL